LKLDKKREKNEKKYNFKKYEEIKILIKNNYFKDIIYLKIKFYNSYKFS
jgi:hypothetical protein